MLEGSFGGHFQPAAARDFHADQCEVLDIVLTDDFCQFFGVVDVVEFGTADEGDAPFDEVFMETGVGIGRAVGGDEQAGAVEVRRMGRDQLQLDRPLAQARWHVGRACRDCFCRFEAACLAARAAATVDPSLGGHVLLDGFFVVGDGFAFDKGDGICRAVRQAVA